MQQSLVNLIIGFSLLLTCHITLATIFAPFPFLFYSLKESSDIFLSQPSEFSATMGCYVGTIANVHFTGKLFHLYQMH